MNREDLEMLLEVDPEIRMEAEQILFALEQTPDGFNTSTSQMFDELHKQEPSNSLDMGHFYMFDLNLAIWLLATTHGLKLDDSHHAGLKEGLSYNLDYFVWHRKNALANGKFDDEASQENRHWYDEHSERIVNAIDKIFAYSLPPYLIPPQLGFSYKNFPVCDAEILRVSCSFDSMSLSFSLNFMLDTGRFSFKSNVEPDPEPQIDDLEFTCQNLFEDFEASWNPETSNWSQPLPLSNSLDF